MKKITLVGMALLALSLNAFADYSLSGNGKKVTCYGPDNQSWVLNASRSTVEYTVEGESQGPKKIKHTDSDGDTEITYSTDDGELTLSDRGDIAQLSGDQDPTPVHCK
jgi:hypothetical protein